LAKGMVGEQRHSQEVVLIGMHRTPEMSDLPFVQEEINVLQELLKTSSKVQTKVVLCPTRAIVLSTLPSQQIIHFSCQRYSSVLDPSSNKLLLNDWKIEPLVVADLTFRQHN